MKCTRLAAALLSFVALLAASSLRGADPGRPLKGSVLGTWDSNWGPVTFRGGVVGEDGIVKFTGFFVQGPDQVGVIKQGYYDPRTRKLLFSYYQDWNDQPGEAKLDLSDDGQTFVGTYHQPNGSGNWTMTHR